MNTIFSHLQRRSPSTGWVRLPLSPQRLVRLQTVLVMLALCMALQMTGFVLIMPLFARRISAFGGGVQALALSAMAFALTSTLAAPWMGALADRFGRRPLILASLFAYVLAFSGYLLVTSAWMFILLRGIAGAFTAGLFPAISGSVADLAPANRRAGWLGIVSGGASSGWIIGPLLGGLLYDRFGYVVPFAVSIAMAVVTLLLAVFLIPETQRRLPQPAARPAAGGRSCLEQMRAFRSRWLSLPRSLPLFLILMLVSFAVMFAWAFIEPQFMFYASEDLNWSAPQLGLAMSLYGVALMLGELLLGRSSDHLGRKPVLVVGLALFSAQFIGLAFFRDFTWIALGFILGGLGNALYDPALSAHILDISPSEHKARFMGVKSTLSSFGSMLGPALVVLVTPYIKPQGVFLIAALLVILLTAVSGLALPPSKRTALPKAAVENISGSIAAQGGKE
jgi:MFS family permease